MLTLSCVIVSLRVLEQFCRAIADGMRLANWSWMLRVSEARRITAQIALPEPEAPQGWMDIIRHPVTRCLELHPEHVSSN